MRTKRRIRMGIAIACVAAGLVLIGWPSDSRVYAGKPLAFWINILNDTSPGFDPVAPWNDLGDDELPVLIEALKTRDNWVQPLYGRVRGAIWPWVPRPLLRHMPQPLDTETIAINALMLLEREKYLDGRQHNPKLRPLIAALMHIMKSDSSGVLRQMAVQELGWFGENDPAVKAALLAAANDKDPIVRMRVSEALRRIN